MAHGAILGQKLEDALLVDGSKSMQANLNMNNHKVTNVTNGTSSADAVNYSQLQTKLSVSGGTMTGPINMGNNKITNVANGVADTDAATVGQLNAAVASSGPQYDHPTGNTNFDFYGLSVITQRTITSRTSITVAESRCFTAAYTYIYSEPEDGDYFKVGFRDIGDITLQYEKPNRWRVYSAPDNIISGTVLPLIGRITIS